MKRILLKWIRFYQKRISPLKGRRTCRFYPTCSTYSYQVISRFGALRGGLLTICRLLKCHQLHPGGIDYPPETFSLRKPKREE